MLKNLFLYYLVILVPLLAIIYLGKENLITPLCFVLGLFVYVFGYRKLIDITRLVQIGAINKSESFKYYVPWKSLGLLHFRSLYFTFRT